MRTVSALCLGVLLLGGAMSAEAAEEADSRTQVEQTVRKLFEAWSTHELELIDELFAADGIYEDVPPRISYRGPEEIKGFLTAIWGWAPDIQFKLRSVAVMGDRAVAEWIMSGTQTGPIGAIPASGNEFTLRGASVMEVRDGRITRNSDYYDLSSLLVQFGVRYAAPPPKGGPD
jgi:steroid delta-isomerase-like uncharacterized protein